MANERTGWVDVELIDDDTTTNVKGLRRAIMSDDDAAAIPVDIYMRRAASDRSVR